jgi:hypothetical protein
MLSIDGRHQTKFFFIDINNISFHIINMFKLSSNRDNFVMERRTRTLYAMYHFIFLKPS